jgi:hypothetical protein
MNIKWLDRTLITGPRVALCLTERAYLNAMRKMEVAVPDPWLLHGTIAMVHHFSGSGGHGRMCIVCLNDTDCEPIQVAGFLIHESVHVWQEFEEFIGEEKAGREFEAYSIEAISKALMAEYVRQSGGQVIDELLEVTAK